MLWYLYEAKGSPKLKRYAEIYTQRVADQQYTTDNHDVGFILMCSFGNGYRLTKTPSYVPILLNGAQSLSTRFKPIVGLIRSWDTKTDKWRYPVIIDNMMNLELLEWAAQHSDSTKFAKIASSHAKLTMKITSVRILVLTMSLATTPKQGRLKSETPIKAMRTSRLGHVDKLGDSLKAKRISFRMNGIMGEFAHYRAQTSSTSLLIRTLKGNKGFLPKTTKATCPQAEPWVLQHPFHA